MIGKKKEIEKIAIFFDFKLQITQISKRITEFSNFFYTNQ